MNKLSKQILGGTIIPGMPVTVDVDKKGEYVFINYSMKNALTAE